LVTKAALGVSGVAAVTKIGIVAIAVGTLCVGGWYAARAMPRSTPRVAVVASNTVVSSRIAPDLAVPAVVADAGVEPDSAASATGPAASFRSSKFATGAPVVTSSTDALDPLLAETRDLGLAQRALRSGDPARALRLLNQQDLTYKHGALQQERAAARVLALCQSSPKGTATAEVERFERRWPKSPLVARLRTSCGLR
jgi:hypothetical protein